MNEPDILTAASAQLTCPECRHDVTYYDVKGSEYYVCPHCHAYFRYSGEEKPQVFGQYLDAPAIAPVLPLGSPGVLQEVQYRVVGVVSRHEFQRRQYSWREYQLFAATTGHYAQLAEYDGHWTLIWSADALEGYEDEFHLDDFDMFNRYQSRINWALGEFDWDIEGDDDLNVVEYIRPPFMLVREQRGHRQQWYRARHVAPAELRAAFGLSAIALPAQEGIGAAQPAPGSAGWPALWKLTAVIVAALLLVQLALALQTAEPVLSYKLQVVADTTTTAGPGTSRVLVSPSFTLPRQTALDVELRTTLSNQWMELPVSLVNEQTGRGFEFTKNIETYSGVEDGESWAEGSPNTDAVLSRVPAGRYHFNLYPITEKGVAAEVELTARPDLALPSNFFVVLALLLLAPTVLWLVRRQHERNRWYNSDFNPYETDS